MPAASFTAVRMHVAPGTVAYELPPYMTAIQEPERQTQAIAGAWLTGCSGLVGPRNSTTGLTWTESAA